MSEPAAPALRIRDLHKSFGRLEVLRGILLKGVGMQYLWREALILSCFAVVLVTLSVRRFSKTLE